jgi:hypothetical protein
MTTDLDTLATALYVKIDDLLKESPHLAPWRPKVGITPKLSDAELVTMALEARLRDDMRVANSGGPHALVTQRSIFLIASGP